jgi:hypothetical protein
MKRLTFLMTLSLLSAGCAYERSAPYYGYSSYRPVPQSSYYSREYYYTPPQHYYAPIPHYHYENEYHEHHHDHARHEQHEHYEKHNVHEYKERHNRYGRHREGRN